MRSILIQHGLLVDTEWQRHADLYIEGSKIKRIAPHIDPELLPVGTTVVNADGKCIMPGIIDAHTHYHLVSRGTVTADSFKEGSRLASFGGVTTIIDFADDSKTELAKDADERIETMKKEMAIDFTLHQGVYGYREGIFEELSALKEKGVGTIKIFTTYKNVGYLIEKKEELEKIFKACKELNIMVSAHCEDDSTIEEISNNWKGEFRPIDHAVLRPSEAEAKAISFVGEIALSLDMPLYIVHLSSEAGLESVRSLRAKGAKLIVETTPHYLLLDKSKLKGEDGSLYVMTPPLREKSDNLALQEALYNGEIQVVATDHCSFTKEQKLSSSDVRTIYPGIPGTEELLPLIHTLAAHGAPLSLNQIVKVLSTGPARYFGIYPEKGSLREDTDADLIIFDPDEAWTISKDTIHSASGYSAFEGTNVVGKVIMTYLRGRLIMGDNVYLGVSGRGDFIKSER